MVTEFRENYFSISRSNWVVERGTIVKNILVQKMREEREGRSKITEELQQHFR